MSLEHLVVPECKELLEQTNKKQNICEGMALEPTESAPNGQCWKHVRKENIVVLEYNPKYKMNTYDSIYTNRNK